MTQEQDANPTETTETQEPKPQENAAEDRSTSLRQVMEELEAERQTEPGETLPEPEIAQAQAPVVQESLPPPSEFDLESKSVFRKLPPELQREVVRLHESRTQAFHREFGSFRDMVKELQPFIEVTGKKGMPTTQAVQKAVALYLEAEKDPEGFARAFAQAKQLKGVKFEEPEEKKGGLDPAELNRAIQEAQKPLLEYVEGEKRSKLANDLGNTWTHLQDLRNAAGNPLLPDLNDSPEGVTLAGKIGSLFLNEEFKRAVKVFNPQATNADIAHAAYLHLGGRIDNSEAPRTHSQQDIAKSRRAAASVPGRGAQSGSRNQAKTYSSRREALASVFRDASE